MYTCHIINYSSSSPISSDISMISDITIDTDLTTDIVHTASKEVELEKGRYNRAARVYFHRKLPNRKRFLKRSLW